MKMKGMCWRLQGAVGQGWKKYIQEIVKNKRFVEDYRVAAVTGSDEDLHVSESELTSEMDKLKIKAFHRHITQ